MPRTSLETSTARIAAAIAEPARARMMFALLDDRARTSTELSLVAGVSASTASAHLARLREACLVGVEVQGRHHYYRIANAGVAGILEHLSVFAATQDNMRRPVFQPSTPPELLLARTCYDHVAGALGVLLHDALLARGWVTSPAIGGGDYSLTDDGDRGLHGLGIIPGERRAGRRRLLFGCLDWSERRPHLGGAIAAALYAMMTERRWVERARDSRALRVTAFGRRELATRLAICLDGPVGAESFGGEKTR